MSGRREETSRVGLCWTCRHARVVATPRGRFWLCRLAATDPRFEKYPRLPVLSCDGHETERNGGPEGTAEGEDDGAAEAGNEGDG